MSTQHDVAFGRLALEHGLVRQDVLRQLYGQLPAGVSLRDELLRRRLLTAQQAAWIDGHLRRRSSGAVPTLPHDGLTRRPEGATLPPPGAPAPESSPAVQLRPGDRPTAAPTIQLGPGGRLQHPSSTRWSPPSPAGSPDDATATLGPGLAPGASSASSAAELPELGATIEDRYLLQGVLGRGGMGAVYRALDRQRGDEPVAIKVMLPGADPDGRALARFKREVEAIARVDAHAGIVRVRAFGLHQGVLPFAVMDLVEGQDLHAIVKERGPLPLADALAYTEGVARAIHHCHERGVLHRDLKPANVLLRSSDGSPHVADFGLALAEDEERLTKTGEVMGTPAYMSPEQAEGDKQAMDALTDVYALGAILYELVTGQAPFQGERLQILAKVFMHPPPPVQSHRPELPSDVDVICQKAMAKDKKLRYASAADLAEDVARLRRGEPIAARPPTRWERLRWRLHKRDPKTLKRIGAAIVLAIACVAIPLGVAIRSQSALDRFQGALRERLTSALAESPLVGDRPTATTPPPAQAKLVDDLADLAREHLEASGVKDEREGHALLRDLITSARSGQPEDDLAKALVGLEQDAPGTLDRAARLVCRVGLYRGDLGAWAPSLTQSRTTTGDPELDLLNALRLLRWRRPPTPEERRASAEVLPLGDQESAWLLLEAAGRAKGEVGVAARGVLREGKAVVSAVERAIGEGVDALSRGEWRLKVWRPYDDLLRGHEPLEAVLFATLLREKKEVPGRVLERRLAPVLSSSRFDVGLVRSLGPLLDQGIGQFVDAPADANGHQDHQPRVPTADVVAAYDSFLDKFASTIDPQKLPHREKATAFIDAIVLVLSHASPMRSRATKLVLYEMLLRDMHNKLSQYALSGRFDDQLAPLVDRLMLFPKLGTIPLSTQFKPMVDRAIRTGVFERYVSEHPEGNAVLVYARARDLLLEKDNELALVLPILRLYAQALGERLSPEAWIALGLGERPRRPPKWVPLDRSWVVYTTYRLAHMLFFTYHGETARSSQMRAAADLLLAVVAERSDELQRGERLAALKFVHAHYLELVASLEDPKAVAAYAKLSERPYTEALTLGRKLLRESTGDRREGRVEDSGSFYGRGREYDPNYNERQLVILTADRVELLVSRGRSAEAMALFDSLQRELAEASRAYSIALGKKITLLALDSKRPDRAAQEIPRLREALGRSDAVSAKIRRRREEDRDRVDFYEGYLAAERGDLPRARVILKRGLAGPFGREREDNCWLRLREIVAEASGR